MTGGQITPKAVQAGSSDEGTDVVNLINRSGLGNRDKDELEEHSVKPAHMWRCAKGDANRWIEFDLGQVQSLDTICLFNYNDSWFTNRGVSKADVSVWTPEAGWQKIRDDLPIDQAQGSDDYDEPTLVKLDGVKAQKVRFDDLVSFDDPDYVGLSEVQFFEAPSPRAIRPQPHDGSAGSGVYNAMLEWRPGPKAVKHKIYLGAAPTDLRLLGTLEKTSARLSTLARGTTYYWRVDEVQDDETLIEGTIWSFTTGRDITGPTDVVVGVPDEGVTTDYSAVGWPPNELPRCAIDDETATKYLHLAGEARSTGFRTTLGVGAAVVTGLTFTTANDAEERDPVSWELYGSNDGFAGPYELIARGEIVDFNQPTAWPRETKNTTPVAFENRTAYKHYQVLFPTVRNPDRANSMQVAEVELLVAQSQGGRPDPGGVKLVDAATPKDRVLAAWWKLDESEGAKVADSSGNGHDGTVRGDPKWLPTGGKVGGAIQFDGVDDSVDTGWIPRLSRWTVAAWVKSPAAPKAPVASGPVHCEENFQINWDHGTDSCRGAAGVRVGGVWHAAGFGDLEADTWYHLLATYDGENLRAYRDGVLISDNADPSGDADSESSTLRLGGHSTADDAFFTGAVDDICIFACALDPDEVKALFCGKELLAIAAGEARSHPLQATPAQPVAHAEPSTQTQLAGPTAGNGAPAKADDPPQVSSRMSLNLLSVVVILAAVAAIAWALALGRRRVT